MSYDIVVYLQYMLNETGLTNVVNMSKPFT